MAAQNESVNKSSRRKRVAAWNESVGANDYGIIIIIFLFFFLGGGGGGGGTGEQRTMAISALLLWRNVPILIRSSLHIRANSIDTCLSQFRILFVTSKLK